MNLPQKRAMRISILMIIGILITAAFTAAFLYSKYMDKENNLVLLSNERNNQKIYILGTIHEYHFHSLFRYSYLEIQNVIDNSKPDLLLLEVEQKAYDEYGVIKSPVEMVPLWCHANESGVAVKGVDWFAVTENSQSWTTDKERDDHIFDNIRASINDEPVVLVILGARHRIEQVKRFEAIGYRQEGIPNKDILFAEAADHVFSYPEYTADELKKQIAYWKTTAIDEVIEVTNEESKGRKYWVKHFEKLTASLENTLDKIIVPNLLYW